VRLSACLVNLLLLNEMLARKVLEKNKILSFMRFWIPGYTNA
jgi:hypothetical protein